MTLAASLGAAAGSAITDWLRAQSSMAGQIIPWPAAGNIPVGWLECDGRALGPADYPRLFAVIGTAYGGDGVATFNLPDLRGRVPLGRSASRAAGTQVGAESVSITLDGANLPLHTHTATFTSSTASSATASVAIPAYDGSTSTGGAHIPSPSVTLTNAFSGTTAAKVYSTAAATTTLKPFDVTVPMPSITGSVAISNAGAGQPLSIPTLPPAVVMTWVICTGIGVTQPVGYSWHGVKTTYQTLALSDLAAKLTADAEFASAVAIMLATGQMTDRIGGSYARWDFDQAKLDAVNLSLSDLQNRMNPAHASYSSRFTDMYKMLVVTGVVRERFPVVRLLPVLTSGNADRLTADWAAGNGLPSGRISVSSVQGPTADTYAAWKAADSSVTSSNWYPASYTQIGSWIQIQLSQAFFPRTIFFRTSPSNYRPTAVKIQAGNSVTSLVDIASFTLAAPVSGASFGEYLLTLPMVGSCTILRMVVTAADTTVIGYPIFDWYATGVLGV